MQLRLLSLNVWGLPWPISRIPDARMRMIAADLPLFELDAIAFQEAWTPASRAILVEGGRKAGLTYAWHRNRVVRNSGLLILSRWPIRDARFTTYDLGGLPQRFQHMDYYGGKGFAQCVLDTPAGEFELFASHLHAGYGNVGYADEYFSHRVAQMIELALAIATTSRPLAVLGDLNAQPHRDEMRILMGATGLTDTAVAVGRAAPTLVPYSPYADQEPAHVKRIDYVLARSGTRTGVRTVESERTFDTDFMLDGKLETFSDHRGVLAELDVAGPGQPLPAPTARSIDRARRAIRHGKRLARRRQAEQRVGAASAALLALGSGATAHYTRRKWLRRSGFTIAGLAALPAAFWTGLAEGFTPGELEGFQRVKAKLDELAQLAEERSA